MKPILTFAICTAILGLSACNEKTATPPVLDNETQETLSDMQRIIDGDNVTFGDLMAVAKAASNPENQKKLACGAMSASAGMAAMAKQSGVMTDEVSEGLMGHLVDMASEIAPTLENTEVSTVAVQTAMKPVYMECLRYPIEVIQGSETFKKGHYQK